MPRKAKIKAKRNKRTSTCSTALKKTIYFVPENLPTSQWIFGAVKNICRNFDDVINSLELGTIEKIIFHPLTNTQTRHYIFHWAKIFNPEIQAQDTTFFSSKPSGSNQVA